MKNTRYENIKEGNFLVETDFSADGSERYGLFIENRQVNNDKILVALMMNPSNAHGYDTNWSTEKKQEVKADPAYVADDTVINLIKFTKYRKIYIVNTLPFVGSSPEAYIASLAAISREQEKNIPDILAAGMEENYIKINHLLTKTLDDKAFDLFLGSGKHQQKRESLSEEQQEIFTVFHQARSKSYHNLMNLLVPQAQNIVVADLNVPEKGKDITGTHPLSLLRKPAASRTFNQKAMNHQEIFAGIGENRIVLNNRKRLWQRSEE